jgi:hypothetical protein
MATNASRPSDEDVKIVTDICKDLLFLYENEEEVHETERTWKALCLLSHWDALKQKSSDAHAKLRAVVQHGVRAGVFVPYKHVDTQLGDVDRAYAKKARKYADSNEHTQFYNALQHLVRPVPLV